MKINKKKMVMKSFLLIGIMTVMLCSLVSALGVASLYGDSSILKMSPGESKDVVITLESSAEEGNLDIQAEITQGSEIVSLIDGPQYSVVLGELTRSNIKVQIPEDADLDTEYIISVTYGEIGATGGEGTVGLVTTATKDINVLVVSEPETEPSEGVSTIWYWIIAIVIIAIIAWILIKKKSSTSVPVK